MNKAFMKFEEFLKAHVSYDQEAVRSIKDWVSSVIEPYIYPNNIDIYVHKKVAFYDDSLVFFVKIVHDGKVIGQKAFTKKDNSLDPWECNICTETLFKTFQYYSTFTPVK